MGGGGDEQTIGYKYYLGMHLSFCHGPINSINKIYVGERLAWTGPVSYDGSNSIAEIYITQPELFGGERKEGGISGKVDIMFGASDQGANDYLSGALSGPIPAFRQLFSVVLNQCYVTANNPYPKPWWVEGTRIPGSTELDEWYPEKAEPTTGSGNAAHFIREILMNKDWGLGYSVLLINDLNFKEVADKLYDEEFGVSFFISNQGEVVETLNEALKTINGVLYTDIQTGEFNIKLIRDDYVIGELKTFDESNILEYSSFQRSALGELVNEITIGYRRKEEWDDTYITFQDLSSITSQGAVISKTINFPGIDDDNIAGLVGMRELRQYSTPLSQATFTVNREAWDLKPGDAFIFSWTERGIVQIIMRVVKINYGELDDGKIEIIALEDIFGLPSNSYIIPQSTSWENPVQPAEDLTFADKGALELPYYLVATKLTDLVLEELTRDSSFISAFNKFPAFASPSFELWTAIGSSPDPSDFSFKATGQYCYVLTLSEDIVETDNEIDIEIDGFPAGFEEDVTLNSLCVIGDSPTSLFEAEIAILSSINLSGNTIQLKRGALDTLPKQHSASTKVWFFEDNWAVDSTEYIEGTSVSTRSLPRTGVDVLSIEDATNRDLTPSGRQYKPLLPTRIRFLEGPSQGIQKYFPESIVGLLQIRWARSNRITQTLVGDPPYFYGNTDVTPEDDIKWEIALYKEDSFFAPVRLFELGGNVTSYDWETEEADSGLTRLNNRIRVRIRAIREEFLVADIVSREYFNVFIDRRGWTYNWSKYWNGEE